MSYLDEDFLKLKRREKYAKYSTLETGIYIKDELVEFEPRDIPELNINASLPKTFVRMPLSIAKIKYLIHNATISHIPLGFPKMEFIMLLKQTYFRLQKTRAKSLRAKISGCQERILSFMC